MPSRVSVTVVALAMLVAAVFAAFIFRNDRPTSASSR